MLKRSLFVAVATLGASTAMADASVDKRIPLYLKDSGVAGTLSSVGSDTLANLMTFWSEEFKRSYPNVNFQIQAAGSSTAPPALSNRSSNFGPMSRAMKDKEIAKFEKAFGYKPTAFKVAVDALAVYVHKDNPIQSLTIPQVDAIFSSARKCGASEDITTWGQAGATGSLAGKAIQLYGRNSVSGTYGYFKKKALCKGDYKSSVNEQPGSSAVVQAVTTTVNGIGYSGIGYKTSGVRAVALAKKPGRRPVPATPEMAASGKYPLARFLLVYVNKHPNKMLPKTESEFLKMVLSKQGQQIVAKDGYIPLPFKVQEKEMAKLF